MTAPEHSSSSLVSSSTTPVATPDPTSGPGPGQGHPRRTKAARPPGRLRRGLRWIGRTLRPPRRLTFTREGRLFVLLAIGVGLAAVNTGNNLLYLLLGWLLSFIIASGVLSELTMKGLDVRRRPPPQVHANQPFLMEIAVENQKARLASFSIEIEDLVGARPLDKKCYFLKIPAGRTQRTSYRHTFSRRGLIRFDGFRIATKFPFALFRKSRDVDAGGEILVYPALVAVVRPAPRGLRAGDAATERLGRRGEFFGLREWRDGDDRRDVHWRSSARAGRLLVREYEDEMQRRTTIVVDNALPAAILAALDDGEHAPDAQAAADALERAISLAASLASSYLEVGWSVQVVARGSAVPMAAGRTQIARVLRTLALLPTVTEDVVFAAPIDARVESTLIAPRGVAVTGRPAVAQVMEA